MSQSDTTDDNTQRKIEALNQILSMEYASLHQYTQYSFLVQGLERYDFYDYFKEQAEESYDHAQLIGNKISSYGGVPSIEVGTISQSVRLLEMLKLSLQMERKVRDAYIAAIPLAEADNDVPLKFLLEQQSYNEQKSVDEIEKLLAVHRFGASEQDAPNADSGPQIRVI